MNLSDDNLGSWWGYNGVQKFKSGLCKPSSSIFHADGKHIYNGKKNSFVIHRIGVGKLFLQKERHTQSLWKPLSFTRAATDGAQMSDYGGVPIKLYLKNRLGAGFDLQTIVC